MYTVIQASGFQHLVTIGEIVRLPTQAAERGQTLSFDRVLLWHDGQTAHVGRPVVDGVTVTAEVLRHAKGRKVLMLKKRQRETYRVLRGHRQPFTEVVVTGVTGPGASHEIDADVLRRARVRGDVLVARVQPSPAPLTRAEKIASGIPKRPKVKKNELRRRAAAERRN